MNFEKGEELTSCHVTSDSFKENIEIFIRDKQKCKNLKDFVENAKKALFALTIPEEPETINFLSAPAPTAPTTITQQEHQPA